MHNKLPELRFVDGLTKITLLKLGLQLRMHCLEASSNDRTLELLLSLHKRKVRHARINLSQLAHTSSNQSPQLDAKFSLNQTCMNLIKSCNK